MDNLSFSEQLQKKLSSLTKGQVTVKIQTESTNSDAKKMALEGACHGSIVLALSQSHGRGRLGRAFSSQKGGLYFSFIVKGPSAQDPARLTISAAVAAACAIEALTSLSVGIKWVNDLYVLGKKCCGILAEGVYDGLSPLPIASVVGIGINLSNPLPKELKGIAISLSDAGENVSLSAMASALTQQLVKVFDPDAAFPIDEYRRRSVLIGKTVTVHTPTDSHLAKVLDITPEGGLLVDTDTQTAVLTAGEVTLHNQ